MNAHAVVQLEALLDATQNRQRILDRRLIDDHRLETPLERGIFLDVLAILVERRRADAVQLAARQHGFEQITRIHRPLGLTGADDQVEFVDEENDAPVALFHLGEHRFQTLFKFASIFRTGDECTHIEREDRPVLKPLGDVAPQDPLREALDDGGLADAGFADEHGIVFRLA